MMLFAIFLSTVLFHVPFVYSENVVSATGGGVVEQGQDLFLTYTIDSDSQDWTMCRWGRYEPSENDLALQYCMFSDAQDPGTVTKLICNPSDLMETNQMEYVGTSKAECKIKVGNTSMDDSVTWAANLGSEPTSKKINVTVATPLDNVTQVINPDPVEAGKESVVSCTVIGGEPVPEITYIFGSVSDNSNLTTSNRIQQTTKMDNGKFKTVSNTTIVPQIKDHGRTIDCVAIQYNKDDPKQILFMETQGTNGSFNANKLTLNVQFPPQPSTENKTYRYVKGSEATISVMIMANPMPTSIKWVIRNANETTGNQTETSNENANAVDIDLPTSEDRNRYNLFNLTNIEDSTKYLANLTVKNVTNSDHLKNYYLMVTNEKGSQNYYFYINVTDFTPPPTTPVAPTTPVDNTTKPSPTGGNGAVTAIVVIVVIAILIVGGVIFYKKYYLNRQTVPHYNLR